MFADHTCHVQVYRAPKSKPIAGRRAVASADGRRVVPGGAAGKAVFAAVLLAGFVATAQAVPQITLHGSKNRVVSKACPNGGDTCTFQLSVQYDYGAPAGNNVTKGEHQLDNGVWVDDSTAMGLPKNSGTYTITFSWDVDCGTTVDVPVEIKITDDEAAPFNTVTERLTIKLSCIPPDQMPHAQGSSTQRLLPPTEDTPVSIEFGILNGDIEQPHQILLAMTSQQGWLIEPPVPPILTLPPGGFVPLDFQVHVPAGTAPGTLETITLLASFADNPNAMSLATTSIVVVASMLPGDLNCDGSVNFRDINPFVLYLSNPSAWQATYPSCNLLNGDINGDGTYPSFRDINPFVALLSGGG